MSEIKSLQNGELNLQKSQKISKNPGNKEVFGSELQKTMAQLEALESVIDNAITEKPDPKNASSLDTGVKNAGKMLSHIEDMFENITEEPKNNSTGMKHAMSQYLKNDSKGTV